MQTVQPAYRRISEKFRRDVNFTTMQLSLKLRMIVMCVQLSSSATVLIVNSFVSTVISLSFLPNCALLCSETSEMKVFRKHLGK